MTRSGRVQSAFDIPCNRLLKMTSVLSGFTTLTG
jgi:hypothetical protein